MTASGDYMFLVGADTGGSPCIIWVKTLTGEAKSYALNPNTFILNDIESNPFQDQLVAVGRDTNLNTTFIMRLNSDFSLFKGKQIDGIPTTPYWNNDQF